MKQWIIICLLLAVPVLASAAELSGKVVSADAGSKRFSVRPFQAGHHGHGMGMSHGGRRHGRSRGVIEVEWQGGTFPSVIKAGELVRLSGRYLTPTRFVARKLDRFQDAGADPPGVRQRIFDHCREVP